MAFTLHIIFEVHFLSLNNHVLLFMSHLHQLEHLKEKKLMQEIKIKHKIKKTNTYLTTSLKYTRQSWYLQEKERKGSSTNIP